ncbi:MAG: FmdB family zinc ribbon protein [Acidimicrobiales bacterium]
MPIYEYACKDCGQQFEISQSFTDEALTTCPTCKGSLRKIFGAVGISFKGSGFYKTDSRGKTSAASTTSSSSPSSDSSSVSSDSGSSDSGSSNSGSSDTSGSTTSTGDTGSSSGSGSSAKGTPAPASTS